MNQKEKKFIRTVYAYYAAAGRHSLPWRKTTNPYRILVSEIMLQQTQVERVIPKYQAFLRQFPSVTALAAAPLGEILMAWQGLGYNRRAKLLHECAQVVINDLKGRWPRDYAGLLALPGVGPYTAGAVLAFAYNTPVPLIETNVRTVYIHHFFPGRSEVADSELLPLITRTLDVNAPRAWYAALMDYGSHLKATVGNKSRASKHHIKQSTFAGSDRQIRGALVRLLSQSKTSMSATQLAGALPEYEPQRVAKQRDVLVAEGLLTLGRGRYRLPT